MNRFSRFTVYCEPSSFHCGAMVAERSPLAARVLPGRLSSAIWKFLAASL